LATTDITSERLILSLGHPTIDV